MSYQRWNFTTVAKINTPSQLGRISPANICPSNNMPLWNLLVSSHIIIDHLYHVVIMPCPYQVSHYLKSSLYISIYPLLIPTYLLIIPARMLNFLRSRRRIIFYQRRDQATTLYPLGYYLECLPVGYYSKYHHQS